MINRIDLEYENLEDIEDPSDYEEAISRLADYLDMLYDQMRDDEMEKGMVDDG